MQLHEYFEHKFQDEYMKINHLDKKSTDSPVIYYSHSGLTSISWLHDDLLHRDEGPAYLASNGVTKYFKQGQYHRVGGPALVMFTSNSTVYAEYLIEGKCHRWDGPATFYVTCKNGKCKIETASWIFNGTNVTDEFIPWAKSQSLDLDKLTEDDIELIKLIWG